MSVLKEPVLNETDYEYDSDEILSQVLDIYEEQENNKIFLSQNTYRDVPEDDKENIFSILESAVNVSDMFDIGGPSEIGAQRPTPQSKRKQENAGAIYENTVVKENKDDTKRFKLLDQNQVEIMAKPNVPANTLRKNVWALNLYNDWVSCMLRFREDHSVVDILEQQSDLLTISNDDLNTVLCSFVLSLRKRDGGQYTSGSLFSVITAIQKHLEINGRRVSLLNDPQFNKLKTCLDNSMQNITRQGIGLVKKQAKVVSKEQENELWEKGILGQSNPQTLLHTVFWTIGVNFGLRGGDEHRNLTRENFKIHKDQDGCQYLEYCESFSKTYKGGIKHRKIDPHRARAYEIVGSDRCPVKHFQLYLSKLNPNSSVSAFYFQPLSKPVGNVWYSLTPIGHNKLKDFVKSIMDSAGFDGYFTNHSLRATTATRLFQENIPEQLIMEQTGHRSAAVYSYKRTSDEQKRLVSSVLQGSSPSPSKTTTCTSEEPLKQNLFNMSNSEIHIHM